jgi:zinc transport system ATP-binding protein
VLTDVSLEINELDFAWVVGPNGGGKTTLLKIMAGLLRPGGGTVEVLGDRPSSRRRMIGYMPQTSSLDPQFPADVLDVALTGLLSRKAPLGRFRRDQQMQAMRALETVDLADLAGRHFSELSGGQLRRLLIARAIVCNPRVLLLDEPTAHLDIRVEEDLYELLERLNRDLTIVMVSHDPAIVSQFVKSVVCVNRVVHTHPTAEIDSDVLSELYGRPVRMVRHDRRVDTEGGD